MTVNSRQPKKIARPIALALAIAFAHFGALYMTTLTLPNWVTAFAANQAVW